MIIVEGPDGAGKTTLIGEIQSRFEFPLHERFVTPAGPEPGLYGRVFDDTTRLHYQPLSIYDRHSFLSEYAYSMALRGNVCTEAGFTGRTATSLLHEVASNSLVILCMPPLEEVMRNMDDGRYQMEGVRENIDRVYHAYEILSVFWPNQRKLVRYDYTRRDSMMEVVGCIGLHTAEWRRDHV